jgi:3',5'-cyclic-AMP phosphodiesterase
VVFVVPGDLHLTTPDCANYSVAKWMTEEVNRLVRPDFVQFIGDNVQHATPEQFALFCDLTQRLQVPNHALAGDHDVHKDQLGHRYQEYVGSLYGSHVVCGVRFLRLCTVEHRPLGLSPVQTEWLRKEVDTGRAAGERIVIFQHHYPYQIWETFDGPGINVWREIVQTRRISAIFTGHTHYGQIANDGRNVAIASRSIGDPEGGPPGYTLASIRGDDLAVTYRSVSDQGAIVLITHPREMLLATGPEHVVSGVDTCRARIWSAEPITAVRGRFDDGAWQSLTLEEGNEWVALLPAQEFEKGEHTYEVRAEDASGAVGRQQITFAVDPTGRFTAVPGVRPVVKGTAFC